MSNTAWQFNSSMLTIPLGSTVKASLLFDGGIEPTAPGDLNCLGIAETDIAPGVFGRVLQDGIGVVLITGACNRGDVLVVSATVPGMADAVAPPPALITAQRREVATATASSAGPLVGAVIRTSLVTPMTPAIAPVQVARVFDDSLSTPPVLPADGDAYIVPTGGLGAWAGLDGHLVEWDGGIWADIFAGVVPIGSRLIVVWTGAGGSFIGHENDVATVDSAWGPGYSYTFEAPSEGQEVYVDSVSYYEDSLFLFDLHPVARWIQVGAGAWVPSDTVVSETTFGQVQNPGTSTRYSRGDHSHGTPTQPVYFSYFPGGWV